MAYLTYTMVFSNNNNFLLKNNIEYKWRKFMQNRKITKESIEIFFNNLNSILLQKYLSYKNIEKITALLTKLLYD